MEFLVNYGGKGRDGQINHEDGLLPSNRRVHLTHHFLLRQPLMVRETHLYRFLR